MACSSCNGGIVQIPYTTTCPGGCIRTVGCGIVCENGCSARRCNWWNNCNWWNRCGCCNRCGLLLLLQPGRQLLLLHERRNEHDLLLGFLQHDLLRVQQQLHGVHLLAVRFGILGLLTFGPAPCARIQRAHGQAAGPTRTEPGKKLCEFFWKDPLPNRKQPAIIHECRCLR